MTAAHDARGIDALGKEFDLPEPLGRVSWSQVQRALDEFDLGTLLSVSPTVTGGYDYNQNAFLSTTAGEFVLKGAPRSPDQFPKERFFADVISRQTSLRCPWPYSYHATPDIFDWPFAIMPRLEGEELNSLLPAAERTPETWQSVARAQALALVQLQAATFDYPGTYSPEVNGIDPFPGSFADWVVGEIVNLQAASPSLTAEESRWVSSLAQRLGRHIAYETKSVIVHGDFGYWNMLFARTGHGYRVTGIFDLLTAMIGDCLADVAFQYTKYIEIDRSAADAFLDTYLGHHGSSEDHFEERVQLYTLYERLNLRDFAHRHGTDWIDWAIPAPVWLGSFFRTAP